MPIWLRKQLMRAYYTKNLQHIKLLNDCWYFYRKSNPLQAKSKK
ncbi:cortex morphogenetic protein CmpA [Longirhabdus pacifica]|nr:cortex morphogenetic protein CmpA [Longirhabdus pacifica]